MHAREVKERPRGRSRTAAADPTRRSAALAPERPPEPGHGTAPQLRVAPPAPVPVPRTPFVALILLVVLGGVLGILLLNTKVNENAFILHDLREDQAALDQRQQELEEEIAQAGTPARLAEEAQRLGLVQAEELAYLRLPGGEMVREPMPADGPPDYPDATGNGAADGAGDGAGDGAADGAAEGSEG